MRGQVLVVDDEPQMLVAMEATLSRTGFGVTTAASGEEALTRIEEKDFSIIFTDLRMPRLDGLELLGHIRRLRKQTPIVLMTAHGSIESAVQAMKQGATDYLVKPFDAKEVDAVVSRLTHAESENLQQGDFITQTRSVRQMLKVARKAAASTATILVEGESGTGKEVLARFIHRSSPRVRKHFVAVNCAAIPENLLESELFGHERGAFTGATGRREGKFELASGGTLLLDEIGEMPLPLQTKLLRVLQEKSVDRVGGREPVPVDLRVVATTNVDLARAVKNGSFRQDLFYRLRVVRLHLPTLRERPEDIGLLARSFCHAFGGGSRVLSNAAIRRLESYAWPGNVRELRNVIECALALSSSAEIQDSDINLDVTDTDWRRDVESDPRTIAQMEKTLILRTLDETRGNRTVAAERLGISIRTLRNKISQYRDEGTQILTPAGNFEPNEDGVRPAVAGGV